MGQVICSLTTNTRLTSEDYAIPDNWEKRAVPLTEGGHRIDGRTVALHLIATLPQIRGHGVATCLLKTLESKIRTLELADRISTTCRKNMVPWFEARGFTNLGLNEMSSKGNEIFDLVRYLGLRR